MYISIVHVSVAVTANISEEDAQDPGVIPVSEYPLQRDEVHHEHRDIGEFFHFLYQSKKEYFHHITQHIKGDKGMFC
jgi:hypothetical protein